MNFYYHFKQGLDIISFWKEILKMSVIPFVLSVLFIGLRRFVSMDSWPSLLMGIGGFLLIYLPLFARYGLNVYERSLFMAPLRMIKRKIQDD